MDFEKVQKVTLIILALFILAVSFNVTGQVVDQKIIREGKSSEKKTSESSAQGKSAIKLLKSDEQGCIVEIITEDCKREKRVLSDIAYDVLHLPGYGLTHVEGYPQLPMQGFLLGIPPEGEIELKIIDSEFSVLPNVFISPVPTAKVIQEDPAELPRIEYKYTTDEKAFKSNSSYPAKIAEIGFSGVIRGQHVVQVKLYPFQYKPLQRELTFYRKILLEISFVGSKKNRVHSPVRDPFDNVLKNTILNYETAKKWKVIGSVEREFDERNIRSDFIGSQYKIKIGEDGVYKVDYTTLQEAGVNVADIDPQTVKIHNQGIEIPIIVHGESDGVFDALDYIEFYGTALTGDFATTNIYWLTWGGDLGLRMSDRDGSLDVPAMPTQDAFRDTLRLEEDTRYWISVPNGENEDHWFWKMLNSSIHYDIPFNLSSIASPSKECLLRVMLYGYSDSRINPDHHISVSLNGHSVTEIWWEGQTKQFTEVVFPQSYLLEGGDTLRLVRPLDTGSIIDISYLNWCEIEYWDSFKAEDNELNFSGTLKGGQRYEVSGFEHREIHLLDVTDTANPIRIIHFEIEDTEQNRTLKFEDHLSSERRYVALTVDKMKKPVSIVKDEPSNWCSSIHVADYLIITHSSFYDQCQPLIDRRRQQGLRTELIDVEDIYDEFNNGIFDPAAIRNFLAYAYYNWQGPPPTYVLLVGDASYDYKDNLNLGKTNYLPTHLVETSLTGQTGSDNWFVCVDGDDQIPDMCIGRMCSRSPPEAESRINKIIHYEDASEANNWNLNTLLVADNEWIFENYSNTLIEHYLPENYSSQKVYYGSYASAEDAEADIVVHINSGNLLTSYIGHGNMFYWSGDRIFKPGDIAYLENGDMLPLVVTVSCLNGYFFHAYHDYCLAEEFLRPESRGAIACWSPTGLGYVSQNFHLEEKLFETFFDSDIRELGIATTVAKILGSATYGHSGVFMDLVETYVLFGDPALELRLPVPKAPAHLVGQGGDGFVDLSWEPNTESDLTGYKVYRSLDSLSGYARVNPDLVSSPAYRDSSVDNGVKYYYVVTAVDVADNESHFSNVAGVTPNEITSVERSPEIEIWVNGESFEDGSNVSPHTIFRITFTDEKGLDCFSAWITIDGRRREIPATEIHCSGLAGLMTEGWFEHEPSLSKGDHNLEAGVKGLSGSIAVKQISFHVIAHLRIEQVLTYPNPMKDEAAFVYQLSWPAEVTIKIYTAAGRVIRTLHAPSADSYNDGFMWDGRDEDGDRVANGLYLYKLIASDGVDRVEIIERLIVMR